MTVAELIAKLQEIDLDATVWTKSGKFGITDLVQIRVGQVDVGGSFLDAEHYEPGEIEQDAVYVGC